MKKILLLTVLLPFLLPVGIGAESPPQGSAAIPDVAGPVLVLDYPKLVKDRQLVRIDASKSDADSIDFDFDDFPAESYGIEGGVAFWAASPGRYRVGVRVAKTVNGKAKQERGTIMFSVEGATPQPPPDPGDPGSPPPVDPGTPPVIPPTGLAAQVKTIVIGTVSSGVARQTVSAALAVWYRNWAKQGASVIDPQSFVAESNRQVDKVLKAFGAANDKQWARVRDEIERKLAVLNLKTTKQHCEAWQKISEGLLEAAAQ